MFGNIANALRNQQAQQPQQGQQPPARPPMQAQPQARPGMFGAMQRAMPQQQQPQQQPQRGGMFGMMQRAMPQQQQPQQRPPMGGFMGRIAGAMGGQQGQMPQQNQMQAGMAQMGGGMGAMLSDKRSKDRIRELEDLNDSYAALMSRDTAKPDVRRPDTDALDRAANYNGVGSYSYEYKDPNAAGAAPGEHVGPMAHELRSIPGVVQPGADGMDRVDTPRLTMSNASAIGEHERDIQDLKEANDALARRQELADLEKAGKKQSSRILSNTPY